MLGWRGVDAMGDRFGDLAEVRAAGGDASGAFVFDPAAGTGEYDTIPDVPSGTLTLFEDTDTGTFDYTDPFENPFAPTFTPTINAASKQLVIVTAKVTADSGMLVGATTIPTPWYVQAWDYTTDPSGLDAAGCGCSGTGFAQATFWAENTTDADVTHDIYVQVRPSSTSINTSCSVTVTVRTLYYA